MNHAKRQAIARKLATLHEKGRRAGDWEYDFVTLQLADADRQLLAQEVDRLRQHKQFAGADLAEQLGADSWILGGLKQ